MRTEEEILEDFKKLRVKIIINEKQYLIRCFITPRPVRLIVISQDTRSYQANFNNFSMELHKLLHELFEIWGWLDIEE